MSDPASSIGGGGGRAAAALQLALRTTDGPHIVGGPVPIEVELRNTGETDVWIVGVLDGSEAGMRFPHYRPAVLHGGRPVPQPSPEDPLVGPLRRSDFRRLSPGEGFDPTRAWGGAMYLPLAAFTQFRPAQGGSVPVPADPLHRERPPRAVVRTLRAAR